MYATPQDILDRYGDTGLFLAGRTEEGLPDTSPLMTALEEASSEIDAALRGRYRLPVESVPPGLRRLAVGLARRTSTPYRGTRRKRRTSSSGGRRPRGNF